MQGFPQILQNPRAVKQALRNTRNSKHIQKQVSAALLPILHPMTLPAIFRKRLNSMLPELGLHIRAIDWDAALSVLKQTKRCFASICCVKTWCNAWTTSARMHDAQQMSCLFGCEGESDNIQHYLRCERLWNPIFQRLRISP